MIAMVFSQNYCTGGCAPPPQLQTRLRARGGWVGIHAGEGADRPVPGRTALESQREHRLAWAGDAVISGCVCVCVCVCVCLCVCVQCMGSVGRRGVQTCHWSATSDPMEQDPTEPHAARSTFLLSCVGAGGGYY